MPNQNGVAEDHKDLMNEFRKFALGYGVITTPIAYTGTGDGPIYKVAAPPPAVSEVWTLVCTVPGGNGVAQFSVTGSVSGAQSAATVGVFYDNPLIEFVIQDGPTNFAVSDQFDITVTQSTWNLGTDEWAVNEWHPPKGDVSLSSFDFPNNAFDKTAATFVSKQSVSSGTLNMKFPDAVAWTEYFIQARNSGFDAADSPESWNLEWSDDGVNWTIEDSRSGQSWTIGETKVFNIPTTDRHIWWRLNVLNNNGGADIEFARFSLRQPGYALYTTEEDSLLLQGQGVAGLDEIYIGFQLEEDELAPYYNWNMRGMTDFVADDPIEQQPGINTFETRFVSNNQLQEYWFNGNGRYLHITARQTTDYTSMNIGFILPYGQPSEYPYPLVILGSSRNNRHYTSTSYALRHCFDPGDYAGIIRHPDGTWVEINNWFSETNDDEGNSNIWPYVANGTTWQTELANVTEGLDGSYEVWPLIIMSHNSINSPVQGRARAMFGEIQDFYWISGSNNSAENTITIGADTYIVFQSVFRTLFNDFYAMRLNP